MNSRTPCKEPTIAIKVIVELYMHSNIELSWVSHKKSIKLAKVCSAL
jgi:hypothetical protein